MLAFALRAKGWYLRQIIVWSKTNPVPDAVLDRCCASHEYILLLSKQHKGYLLNSDNIREETRSRRSVWETGVSMPSTNHGATYPDEIPKLCILAGSNDGDFIIDPFFGSGTTGKVANDLNRKFIGVEIVETYAYDSGSRTNTLFNETTII